jgi:hypothetical protein
VAPSAPDVWPRRRPRDEIGLRRLSTLLLAAALEVEPGADLDDLLGHPLAESAYGWLRRQSGGPPAPMAARGTVES